MPKHYMLAIPFLLLVPSCAPEEVGATSAPAESPRAFVAAVEGGLAVLDPIDGHVIARTDSGVVDDVVVDRARRRIVSFEIDPNEEGGELWGRSFDLGLPALVGRSAGVVRLAATAPDVVVFEDANGSRWRLLDGPRSVFAPPPRSTWATGDSLFGLTFEPDAGWGIRRMPLEKPGSIELSPASPASRMVAVGTRLLAFDVVKGSLAIDGVDAGLAASAVVDACALSSHRFALLTAAPTRVVVGELDGILRTSSLEGEPRFDARYLSPSLVALSSTRLAVATTQRVVVVDVQAGHLVVDARFAPHGAHAPIAGPL